MYIPGAAPKQCHHVARDWITTDVEKGAVVCMGERVVAPTPFMAACSSTGMVVTVHTCDNVHSPTSIPRCVAVARTVATHSVDGIVLGLRVFVLHHARSAAPPLLRTVVASCARGVVATCLHGVFIVVVTHRPQLAEVHFYLVDTEPVQNDHASLGVRAFTAFSAAYKRANANKNMRYAQLYTSTHST